jgi:hypothetical protein
MKESKAAGLLSRLVLAGLIAVVATAFVACSGKDDDKGAGTNDSKADSSSSDKGDSQKSGSPSTRSGAFDNLFRLSSGDSGTGSSPRPQTSAKPTKDDERYVRQICVAATEFIKALEKLDDKANASKTPEITSADDFGKAFAEIFGLLMGPMADFLDGFARAQPPKDLQEWHAKAAKYMTDAAKSLRKGDFEALNKLDGANLPDPPEEAIARVEKAVENVKECTELDKLSAQGSSLFGGK